MTTIKCCINLNIKTISFLFNNLSYVHVSTMENMSAMIMPHEKTGLLHIVMSK